MTTLAQYLGGGAAGRSDSISGLSQPMQDALTAFFAEAPGGLTINSAYRSPELQAQLWEDALQRYGTPEEARRWVAPPGNSQHNHGNAVDLGYASDDAMNWAHQNAGRFGLGFPLGNENWHMELAGAREGVTGGRPEGMNPPQRQQFNGFGAGMDQNALASILGDQSGNDFLNRNSLADLNRDENAFRLDPREFMSQGYSMQGQQVNPLAGMRFATRYLGAS